MIIILLQWYIEGWIFFSSLKQQIHVSALFKCSHLVQMLKNSQQLLHFSACSKVYWQVSCTDLEAYDSL